MLPSFLVLLLLGAGGIAALVARNRDGALVRVLATDARGDSVAGASYPLYLDYRAQATAFDGLAAYFDSLAVEMQWAGAVEQLTGSLVSGNYFAVLRAGAALGRPIAAEDERVGARPVVVLSHRTWRDGLSGDSAVIGRPITLNGRSFTVVGVMPPDFHGAGGSATTALWAPISAVAELAPTAAELQPLRRRGLWWLSMVGRLAPRVTIDDARAELDAITARLRATGGSMDPSLRVVPLEPPAENAPPPAAVRTERLA